jgi:hypothetical protein
MNNKFFTTLCLSLSFLSVGLLKYANSNSQSRNPASSSALTLEITHLKLPPQSQLSTLEDVSIRATFNRNNKVDLLGRKVLSLAAGQSLDLDLKVAIDPSWIQNDQLEFKLEIVKKGILDKVLVRCAQISRKISDYNRSYQCFIPGDEVALLTYRISGDKAAPRAIARK